MGFRRDSNNLKQYIMQHFVTVEGKTVGNYSSRSSAINRGYLEYKKKPSLGTLNIGIGKYKITKGVKCYNLLPLHFFKNN